jgi:hypothetical protein
MSSKKSPPEILKKRQTHFKDMAAKIVLESPTQSKNKEEQCLEISCNFFLILDILISTALIK